jgi:hypothetical protein
LVYTACDLNANQNYYNAEKQLMRKVKSYNKEENIKKKSVIMRKFFNIETTNQFYIHIPTSINDKCLINEVIQVDSLFYAKGIKLNKDTGDVTSILMDFTNIITLKNSQKDIFRFIVPFSISVNKSLSQNYIGLFELNTISHNINHDDSYFLGDGITLKSLIYDDSDNIKITFSTALLNQSFSKILEIRQKKISVEMCK